MLSPRIIHFTHSQVFWDCSTVSACESLPDGLPFALSAIATTDRRWRGRLQRKNSGQESPDLTVEDSLESFWKTAVLNYTSCELTNQADKTFAIWSVAKLVRDHLAFEDEYGCGLWATVLHEQLAWQVKSTRKNARMDTLQSIFPSWSWASVNAPIQISDRLVDERSYTIKNHDRKSVAFEEFVNKGVNRDLQPEFATSDSLAVCGYTIPGRLQRSSSGGMHTFEYATAAPPEQHNSLKVILDEEPTDALLEVPEFYFLPLAVRKFEDQNRAYSGSALVLIATHDFRHMIESKLKKQIIELANLCRTRSYEGASPTDRRLQMRMLRMNILAVNAWLHKKARQDREMPVKIGRAFRRIGVIHFTDLPGEEWIKIRTTEERKVWLD